MRKLIALCIAVFCVIAFAGVFVNAAAEDNGGEKIEISFKVGDDTLKINNEDVKVEKPFVVNGVTLVPLRVITEAFGAEVTWSGTDKSIELKYGEVLIKLVVGSKDAVVDGKKSALLQAPVINNGSTMVPMRFITENFGADVTYEKTTQAITVVKEIANSNSIKDFGLLLKKTNKSKVGDSFYNWSMSLPKKLKMTNRDFNGTINNFDADDGSYSLSIIISKLDDETLDSILSKEIDDAKDYTLLDQGIKAINGENYVLCAGKGQKFAYEDRIFIKNGRIYSLYLYVPDYNDYKNNKDLTALLDSFSLKYANDGSTEDLSDIGTDGLRKYENKKLKWSISVQPEMEEVKNEDKENEVKFYDENNNCIAFKMYSIENGLTLDAWVEDELKIYKELFNNELTKVLSVEEGTFNNVRCKKMLVSSKLGSKMIYYYDIYMLGKNYRYDLSYLLREEDYNNAEIKKKYGDMINTFKSTEPDKENVGQLIDPDRIAMSDSVRKVENKDFKWSFELPVSWTADSDNSDSVVRYTDKYEVINMIMLVQKGVSFDAYISSFEEKIQEQSKVSASVKIDKKESLNEKGTSVMKYQMTTTLEDYSVKEQVYILSKNGNLYFLDFSVNELNWAEKNINTINTIWQSAKFE